MPSAAAATGENRNLAGILLMVLAVGLLSVMDAGLKALAPHYPPMQVAALRSLASWPLAVAWIAARGGLAGVWRVRWPLHLARGALGIMMLPAFVYALRYVPLTTAYTIFFVAPLMITALSVPLLGERVSPGQWGAIGIGFAGVLVALRPTGEGVLTLAGLALVAGATGYALAAIIVRVLARTDSTHSMVLWQITIMAFGAAALAWPGWVPVQAGHWWLVLGVGLVGFAGQYALTEAFARGEASVIAPFEYTALGWGLGLDAMFWGVLPDGVTWLGAAIIIASGLYLMRRERLPSPPVGPSAGLTLSQSRVNPPPLPQAGERR